MEITVSSRNTEVSDDLRSVTHDKIGRLSRFLDGMDHAEVHFFEEKNPRIADKEICEVTLAGHGHHVRCKVAAPDGYAAVDRAVAKLEQQLHKLKTKLVKRQQKPGRGRPAGPGEPDEEPLAGVAEDDAYDGGVDRGDRQDRADADGDGPGGREPRIVKSKRFTMKPMMPEEASLQMEMLNHDFFFFTNAETDRSAVIYRRDDGDIGLIDEAD
ncbi:ribosome-associated translation inhibitor RaiA [soil metagenome]